MKNLKSVIPTLVMFALCVSFTAEGQKIFSNNKNKRTMICLMVDGYNDPWRHVYKTPYPAKKIFDAFDKIGVTDIQWQLERLRGREVYFPTSLKTFKYNPQLNGRDWLEETLTEADKHNMKVWLAINPAYANRLTGLKGLKAQTKNYVNLIHEIGKTYSKRHKSLAGIFHHETHAAESPDFHSEEIKDFSEFCEKRFKEKYTGQTMPNGEGKDKWNNRFYLYKAYCLDNFVKALNTAAGKYGLKSIYCYYPIECLANAISWGVDIAEIEKSCDELWVAGKFYFYNSPNTFQELFLSYRGANVAQRLIKGFHGQPASIFEAQLQLFPETYRESKRVRPEWTKRHGDAYDFFMRSKKSVSLFQGIDNTKKWLNLQRFWQGGELQSNIAFVLSSYSFTMRHRPTNNISWGKFYSKPLEMLKKSFPVSTLVIDRNYFENYKNLKKYKLIIIPESMGVCITSKALESIKKYLSEGGQLLAVRTGISSSKKDLTNERDYTNEIFGIAIKKLKNVAGYHKLLSSAISVPKKKIWGTLSSISNNKAKVIIKDAFSGKPVLTKNGNAWFLALSLDNISLLKKIIEKLAPPAINLKNNKDFSIPAVVHKDNMLCIPLASEKAASAVLSINARDARLSGSTFEIKNIVTGKTIVTVNVNELQKGVKVKTDFDSEPLVLAVGPKAETKQFKGIYPNNKVFEGIAFKGLAKMENPEVAISIPDKPGIKVGIYQNGFGSMAIYNALKTNQDFNVFFLPRLDTECMNNAEVIIVPQAKNVVFFRQGAKMIKHMVLKAGRGVLLTHNAAVNAKIIFPELKLDNLGKFMRIKNNYLELIGSHPANSKIKAGSKFIPGFAFDHYAFRVNGFSTLAVDKGNCPVICVGKLGKGKVALYGSLPGRFGTWEQAYGHDKGKLHGVELKQMIATIKWLGSKK